MKPYISIHILSVFLIVFLLLILGTGFWSAGSIALLDFVIPKYPEVIWSESGIHILFRVSAAFF